MFNLGQLAGRVAAAPISWGVCEVPGWGAMLAPHRVLPEMQSLGLNATELGAPGFLPHDSMGLRSALGRHSMSLIGGFVPLVLHDPSRRAEALEQAEGVARLFADCGGTEFVTAAVADYDWPRPNPLDVEGMKSLGDGLAAVDELCAKYGLTQVLHPHVDTLVETARDVALALEHTSVRWCLDTGHLQIGGVDPVAFARDNANRVGHVHLKDVDNKIAARVLRRQLTLLQGVRAGLFTPLGAGDVAVDEAILALEVAGYRGWYVLEQDTALFDGVPAPGTGPVDDVRASVAYLESRVATRLPAGGQPSITGR